MNNSHARPSIMMANFFFFFIHDSILAERINGIKARKRFQTRKENRSWRV
jgi:hypothetical protein